MTIRLKDLFAKTKTIPVALEAESAGVTYRVYAATPALAEKLASGEHLEEVIVALVERWDVLDDAGAPVPVTLEAVHALPLPWLGAVQRAVLEDLRAPKASAPS